MCSIQLRRPDLGHMRSNNYAHAHAQDTLRSLVDEGLLPPGLPTPSNSSTPSTMFRRRTYDVKQDSDPKDSQVLKKLHTGRALLSKSHSGLTIATGQRPPLPVDDKSSIPSKAIFEAHLYSMPVGNGHDRRDRSLIGCNCATCEEPLEHTLRGERILQLSCGHVSHEVCFYECIKEFETKTCPSCEAPLSLETSRGGGSIDFDNLNNLVRSAQSPGLTNGFSRENHEAPARSEAATVPESAQTRASIRPQHLSQQRPSRDPLLSKEIGSGCHIYKQSKASDDRNRSVETAIVSTDTMFSSGRRHDYDVQAMETALTSLKLQPKLSIPPPTVIIRSEFPTLSRSRQQQNLTCLVTVEAMDGKWQPSVRDLERSIAEVPSLPEEVFSMPQNKALPAIPPLEPPRPVDSVHEDMPVLDEVRDELFQKVQNWHGLELGKFGRLILHGVVRVGKDCRRWQDLECYLFSEMLICVKEKKTMLRGGPREDELDTPVPNTRCTLKGSILIKKHLSHVGVVPDSNMLTLSLSVIELPSFHLQFHDEHDLEVWRHALNNLARPEVLELQHLDLDQDLPGVEEEEYNTRAAALRANKRTSAGDHSSNGGKGSPLTAPTEYSNSRSNLQDMRLPSSMARVPVDIVVVIPVSSSMQGLKINLLRDSLRFLVSSLSERDRMGLVTFGSGGGSMPLVGMTGKTWDGWSEVLDLIRPTGHKKLRGDVVEGANVAMDLLMQRRSSNPLASILVVSDSANSDCESVDFVVSRAEATKISIHSFGLGLSHKPDSMVEMSTRTKASYTYVKDWMMLRECLAGCLGALQSASHQNVKLKLRLPEGSPAKFVKIGGALHVMKRATGRDAEVLLGDLRIGDKRDILVQLAIPPSKSTSPEMSHTDPWENVIAGLEALGGGVDQDELRGMSVEEVPLIQADLSWSDLLRESNITHLSRPSLLAITVLPPPSKRAKSRISSVPSTLPIPPHPSVVQRRMELLTSDMLARALTLVSAGKHDRAQHLLAETRAILRGLGKGRLPPLPPPPSSALPPTPARAPNSGLPATPMTGKFVPSDVSYQPRTPSPQHPNTFSPAASIDAQTLEALDYELGASLEWIAHPAVFARDARKAVLQAIGVISSQRAFTFRSPAETLWASRIPGVRHLADLNHEWRESTDARLAEEES